MKSTLSVLLILITSFTCISQEEWKDYQSNSGVNIYSRQADCYPKDGMAQTAVLFKFQNTNNQEITIEWDVRIWYNGVESTQNVASTERHYILKLNPNQIIQSNTELTDNRLFLYKKFLNFEKSQMLTHFELTNIKVTK